MNGAEAAFIHRAREKAREGPNTFAEYMLDFGMDTTQQSWSHTWGEFIKYAQQGDRGRLAKENEGISVLRKKVDTRETHPTLYPGEVEGENETCAETGCPGMDMSGLSDRARANQHRKERKGETHKEKRKRLAKGEYGTRRVSERPKHRPGGGEWELPPCTVDISARKLLGGHDGRGKRRVFKDEAMDIAHKEEYAGHPILRLFTRPEEMENGIHMRPSKEDIAHMNSASGKKLTYDT
eukprot:3773628-Pleurochrysis_carterae.AAC.3